MIVSKTSNGNCLCELLEGKTAVPCLVTDQELRKFVERLRVGEVRAVATRLMIVAIAAAELWHDPTLGRFEGSNKTLIRQLASEGRNRKYKRLMRRIVAALEQGRDGFNLIYLTAIRALSFICQSIPDYKIARQLYDEDIRQIRGMSEAIDDQNFIPIQDR